MTDDPAGVAPADPRVVIVTGGSRGIGAGIVADAVADGWAVCFTYSRDETGARETLGAHTGAPVVGVRADVMDEAAMQHVFDVAASMGEVTALVNNAGTTGPISDFSAITTEDLRRVVDVNLVGTALACRIAVNRWESRPAGKSIVNVSSVAAKLGAPFEYIPYAAAKAGIEALTRGLAKELGPRGTRVNAVSPGTTLTGIHALAGDPDRPARVAARIPLGRAAEPREISAAVRWLLSTEASYVTGTVLEVTGGL